MSAGTETGRTAGLAGIAGNTGLHRDPERIPDWYRLLESGYDVHDFQNRCGCFHGLLRVCLPYFEFFFLDLPLCLGD